VITRRTSKLRPETPVPQHVARSTETYAHDRPNSGVQVRRVVDPVQLVRHDPLVTPGGYARAFDRDTDWGIPARMVATISQGRVFGPFAAVMTSDDTMLWDMSPAHVPEASQHPIYRWPVLPRTHDVDGTVGVLAARGAGNYFHFLLDIAPRVELIRRAMPLTDVDRLFIDHRQGWQREILEAAGVDLGRTLSPGAHPHVRADRLVVPSLPGSGPRMNPRWALDAVRSWLLPEQPKQRGLRIYVSRGANPLTRRVVNEDEVMAALGPYGFVKVRNEDRTVREQAEMFASAEIVVGAHGAGLANIAFCSPGATVVELVSPRWLNTTYWRLCSQLDGVNHRCLVGRGRAPRDLRQYDVNADIEVDVKALSETLRAIDAA
jgi:capsular polysaccharide biosynthesis protein